MSQRLCTEFISGQTDAATALVLMVLSILMQQRSWFWWLWRLCPNWCSNSRGSNGSDGSVCPNWCCTVGPAWHKHTAWASSVEGAGTSELTVLLSPLPATGHQVGLYLPFSASQTVKAHFLVFVENTCWIERHHILWGWGYFRGTSSGVDNKEWCLPAQQLSLKTTHLFLSFFLDKHFIRACLCICRQCAGSDWQPPLQPHRYGTLAAPLWEGGSRAVTGGTAKAGCWRFICSGGTAEVAGVKLLHLLAPKVLPNLVKVLTVKGFRCWKKKQKIHIGGI